MPRKNRGYKRGEPHRDARLFVIACEGAKREKEYFEALVHNNQRVKVQMLVPAQEEDGKSAPKWILDRATHYIEEYGLGEHDQLWLVMDIDRWTEQTLREIIGRCKETANWHAALSNPCFELWLILHQKELPKNPALTCKELKNHIHELVPGGYKAEEFIKHADHAIARAKLMDEDITNSFPAVMVTKVYQLGEAISEFL